MKPYEFRLGQIEWEPDTFAAALRAHGDGYTGRFVILPETRYQKVLVEHRTDWCAAELWIYNKDGGPFPEEIALTVEELAMLKTIAF